MDRLFDNIMINKSLDDNDNDSEEFYNNLRKNILKKNKKLIGGNNNFPTGGFPPIFICDKESEKEEKTKDKDIKSVRTFSSVSIADIFKNKK